MARNVTQFRSKIAEYFDQKEEKTFFWETQGFYVLVVVFTTIQR